MRRHNLKPVKVNNFFWLNLMNLVKSRFFEWLSVGILVLAAAWCRFVYFPETIVWTNDSARDVSVAYLISNLNIWPTVGHFNTGINGYYPPYYFYFLGLLAKINSTPAFIVGVNVMLQTFGLIFYYWLGKICLGKKVGFLMLGTTIYSANLIFTALYAAPASWNLNLYLVCFALVISWFVNPKNWKLFLSLSLGLAALQVHGAQIVLIGFTLIILLVDLIKNFVKKSKISAEILSWFLLTALVFWSQLPLLKILLKSSQTASSWNLLKLFEIFEIAKVYFVFDYLNFERLKYIYLFLASLAAVKLFLVKTSLGKSWLRKFNFKLISSSTARFPGWWWFCLSYLGFFELSLSMLSTGLLAHHQNYLYIVWLLVAFGLAKVLLEIIFSKKIFRNIGLILIGLVWIKIFAVPVFKDLHSVGSFNKTQILVQKMSQANFPIETADVLMMDNFPSQPDGISNSFKVWWFLISQYGRRDLSLASLETDFQSPELILICDFKEAKQANISCDQQIEAILAKRGFPQELEKSLIIDQSFNVTLYKTIRPGATIKP